MPQFDRTGPQGEGRMTGRKQGRCTNFGAAKAAKGKPLADEAGTDKEALDGGQKRGRGQEPGRGLGRGAAAGRRGGGKVRGGRKP